MCIRDRCKGVIVRGAKICNSNAPYVDEIIVTPTKFMGRGDEGYAISFALPGDWPGMKLMALPGQHHKRKHLEAPFNNRLPSLYPQSFGLAPSIC